MTTSSGFSTPGDGEEVESKFDWLDNLPNHPIFSPFSGQGEKNKTIQDVLMEKTCMVLRDSDILVAHGKELRMTSLIDAKFQSIQQHQQESIRSPSSSTNNSLRNATYKRLLSPSLDFEIERMIVNPTGTLLAIIGSYKVVVIILPRSGALNQSKGSGTTTSKPGEIKVKGAIVGGYYHHERVAGRMRLADVKWHPWGEMGSSLLIMTKDGILREYNVSTDFEEPAQTVSLLPGQLHSQQQEQNLSKLNSRFNRGTRSRSQTPMAAAALARSRRSTSRLAFDDRSESEEESRMEDVGGDDSFYTAAGSIRSVGGQNRTAVSFTFGIDERSLAGKDGDEFSKSNSGFISADWTPFTIFTLCTNGDMYSLCPFMPKKASIRSSYLHSLASYVRLSRPDTVSAGSGDEGDLQIRFITSLLKQASAQRTANVQTTSSPIALRSRSTTPMALDESRGSTREPEESLGYSELVNIQAPNSTIIPCQPQAQGPFLLTPAPHEISEEREARGADLFYARVIQGNEGLNVIGIASDDGRIDLCISLEPIMPNWTNSKSSKNNSRFNSAKSGRYALSDSEDEDEDEFGQNLNEENEKSLPSLFVYESIDLGILSAMKDVYDFEHALRTTPIRFVSDPFYSDIVYVHHLAGAHAIGFGRWSKSIIRALSEESEFGGPLSLERTLHRGTPSEVACVVNSVPSKGLLSSETAINPICSLSIISDAYLEYSFLSLAHSGKLIAVKFDFQFEDDSFHDAEERFTGETSFIGQKDLRSSALEVGDLSQIGGGGGSPSLYISLLDNEPAFTMPKPFEALHGLPSQPRVTSGLNKSEIRVTPETLRSLGTIVETLRGQMREITRGGESIQTRIDLQAKEMKRQLDKIDIVAKRIEVNKQGENNKTGSNSIEKRMKKIFERQKVMIGKSDRLLQKLIDQHSPELSIYEQRWLAELTQMQKELGESSSRKDEYEDVDGITNLTSRVGALRHQLDSLKPQLERSTKSNGDDLRNPSMFGTNQLREMETLLANEEKLLEIDTRKINQLNTLIQKQIRAGSQSLT